MTVGRLVSPRFSSSVLIEPCSLCQDILPAAGSTAEDRGGEEEGGVLLQQAQGPALQEGETRLALSPLHSCYGNLAANWTVG